MDLRTKRIYEPVEADDGLRVLVDRLWPRGVSKARAEIDLWLREVAPSHDLRTWFGHDPRRWEDFVERYRRELDELTEPVAELRSLLAEGRVTLVYSARDARHNQAVALAGYLEQRKGPES